MAAYFRAHYNPAATLGLWVSKKIHGNDALKYMAAQLLVGFVAAGAYAYIKKDFCEVSWMTAFVVEVFFTFALMTQKTKGNQYYGLAIGMTLLGRGDRHFRRRL